MKEAFLINPVRKRKSRRGGLPSRLLKRMHRKYGTGRRALREAWKRYKRGVRNPLNDLMLVNNPNPKKRGGRTMRRRRKKRNPAKHRLTLVGRHISRHSRIARRMRGARINRPSLPIPKITTDVINDLVGVTFGYVSVKLIPQLVFPASWRIGVMDIVGKAVAIVGTTMVSGMVFKRPGIQKAVMIGGILTIVVDLLNTVSPLPLRSGHVGYLIPANKNRIANDFPENEIVDTEIEERY